jgi:uncharacterized lipoprotein YajG
MKNLLLFVFALSLFSCVHQDQKITFDLKFDDTQSNIGKGVGVDLVVIDARIDDTIGEKIFSKEEKIKIISSENLAEVLQKKISANLLQKGFKKGWAKTIEVEIVELNYQAKREFFVGSSNAAMKIKVTINDNKKQSSFTKNFDAAFNAFHFIAPLESTDLATINNLVTEVINNALSDKEVLSKLAQ